MEQLQERIKKRIAVDTVTGCWNWTGYRTPDGYGRTSVGKRCWRAHRYVYTQMVRAIPEGMQLDHLCRNRACVNPAHTEEVTHAENTARGILSRGAPRHALRAWKRPGSVTSHCPQGHAYDNDNTYVRPNGLKECRACRKEKDKNR